MKAYPNVITYCPSKEEKAHKMTFKKNKKTKKKKHFPGSQQEQKKTPFLTKGVSMAKKGLKKEEKTNGKRLRTKDKPQF